MGKRLMDDWGINTRNFTNDKDALSELQKLLLQSSLAHIYVTIYLHREEISVAFFRAGFGLETSCSAPTIAEAIHQTILSWIETKENEVDETGPCDI